MTKILKIVSAVGVALVFFLLVSLIALSHLVRVGEFRRFLIDEVESRTQFRVTAGEAELHLGWVMGISIRDIVLRERGDVAPVIKAEGVLVRVALLPLLERRIVFDEIRFYRPEIQIGGAAGGEMPLQDLMGSPPLQKIEGGQFNLVVHKITMEEGKVLFPGLRGEKGTSLTRFREMDLDLRSIKAEEIPSSAPQLSADVLAIEYSLKTMIERGGSTAGLASEGKILFPKGPFQPRQVWLDAGIEVAKMPVDLLRGYHGYMLPGESLNGILSSSLRWRGNLAERVRIEGEVNFQQLEVRAPEIFADRVAPGDGRLDLKVELSPGEIQFRRLDLRSDEIRLSARGSMRSLREKDPYLEVHLTTRFLSLLTLRRYIPLRVSDSRPWKNFVRVVKRGELRLTKAGVVGHLSELRRLFRPGFEDRLWLHAEVRGVSGNLAGDRDLPVRGVSGRVVLEKGVLYYKGFKGTYGLSRLEEIEGSQRGVFTDHSLLEISAKGEADLRELSEQWSSRLRPPRLANMDDIDREIKGKGKIAFSYRTDFETFHHYKGQLSLGNVGLRIGDVSLSKVRGDISFSPTMIRTEDITALFADSPVRIKGRVNNYQSGSPTFDFTVESPGVKAAEISRILRSVRPRADKGTVRGKLRYQGSLSSNGNRTLSGSLELAEVRLSFPFVNEPLREVHGMMSFDKDGIDLRDFRGQVEIYGLEFNGRWRYREAPDLTFTLSAPEMDLSLLLTPGEAEIDDRSDRLQAEGRISIGKGKFEGFKFSELKTDLTLDRGQWFLEDFSARSQGGTIEGVGSYVRTPKGLSFSVKPRIQGVPVNNFLGWFDMGTRELTGNVNLSGMVAARGKTGDEIKEHLNGAFQVQIEDGILRRARTLVRVLSLMDLSKWFTLRMPDINQEGIRFRRISGDFKVSQGVYSTKNLLLDSDELLITGSGKIGGPKDEIDFVIALRPFPGVNSAVSYVPLIGHWLGGIKDSLLVAGFRIKGPIDDPGITPVSLSALPEYFYGLLGLPKRLIERQGKQTK